MICGNAETLIQLKFRIALLTLQGIAKIGGAPLASGPKYESAVKYTSSLIEGKQVAGTKVDPSRIVQFAKLPHSASTPLQ